MNLSNLLPLSVLFVSISSAAQVPHLAPPHLDLEMTSEEYAPYLQKANKMMADEPPIADALRLGMRLSAWIKFENAKRPADQQIRLTSPGTRTGIPIDAPSQYSPAIIQTRLDTAMAAMPAEMRDILNTRLPYPDHLPLADADFIVLGRKLDRVYQSAARWKTLKPYMSYYTEAKSRDVRGFYYLKKNGWTAEKLAGYSALDADTQKKLQSALILICINSDASEAACSAELQKAIVGNTLGAFFTEYYANAESNWNDFFNIPSQGVRSDIVWTSANDAVLSIPFNRPTVSRIESYLRDNIEDEWKWKGWNLRLNFGTFADGPRVQFETGVVPHVNGIGGNLIIMDENQSVEEYESQWTIRHEFGHVLGFPDCYHEFYDPSVQAFVNYQLDITDLMCSRAGNMTERLYTELKRVYFKN